MKNNYEYEQDEPFGWYDGMGFSTNKNDFGKAISTATPLYTHPAPAREPLSDHEVDAIAHIHFTWEFSSSELMQFARAIEKAHGIGGSNGS